MTTPRVTVPVEPTDEMLDAAMEYLVDATGNYSEWARLWMKGCLRAALRAQPQAREEAQPVAWNGRGKCDCSDDTGLCPRCFPDPPSVANVPYNLGIDFGTGDKWVILEWTRDVEGNLQVRHVTEAELLGVDAGNQYTGGQGF